MRSVIVVSIFLLSVTFVAAQNKPAKLSAVSSIDLNRYQGRWYEIAKYPNKFQKQCVGNTTANYTLKQNGRIEVVNTCVKKNGTTEKATGEAKIGDKNQNSKLKVRFAPGFISFLPFVWANYWVIDIDQSYSYVMIGEPDRDYFWILSRTPDMKEPTYQSLLRKAETLGFQPARVVKTPQNVEVLKGAVNIGK